MQVPRGRTVQYNIGLRLLGDVSMVTVMTDLQICALPSIWLRLANQVTSTHTNALSDLIVNEESFGGESYVPTLPSFSTQGLLSVTVIYLDFVQLTHKLWS